MPDRADRLDRQARRVRLVHPVFIEPDSSGVYVSSPAIRQRLRVAPEVVPLLLAARVPLRTGDGGALPGIPLSEEGAETAVELLLKLGFMVECEDDEASNGAAAPEPWDAWGDVAWWFHQRTRNVTHLSDPEQIQSYKSEVLPAARPAAFRPVDPDQPILLLPRTRIPMPMAFQDVLESRRTHRRFTGAPVSLEAFAGLLHYTFAPLRFADCGELGVIQLRTSASGGARHPSDAYVAVFDVRDVAPGLYFYDAVRHGLLPVGSDGDAERSRWEELTFHQGFFDTGGFAVITVAVPGRTSWKYRHARAYRILMQDVGHVAQVFSMTATALGLGAALTGAFRDDEVDAALRLDAPSDFAAFVMVCGVPETQETGMPVDFRPPSRPWRLP